MPPPDTTPALLRVFHDPKMNKILAISSYLAEPVDVTSDVLKAVVEFVGAGHTLGVRSGGRTVVQISVTAPEAPAN